MTKRCNDCKIDKPIDDFGRDKNSPDGHNRICKSCACERNRNYRGRMPKEVRERKRRYDSRYRADNLEHLNAEMRRYYEENRERLKAYARENGRRHRERMRREVIEAYGGRCACCGEDEGRFLTLDHVNGRRPEDKVTRSMTGAKMYARARREGYPDDYQLLCWNCNAAKGIYGECPHQNAGLKLVS